MGFRVKKASVKIGVAIMPHGMGDDCRALKYLILRQNTIQQIFELRLLSDDLIEQPLCGKRLESDAIANAMPEIEAVANDLSYRVQLKSFRTCSVPALSRR